MRRKIASPLRRKVGPKIVDFGMLVLVAFAPLIYLGMKLLDLLVYIQKWYREMRSRPGIYHEIMSEGRK